MGIELRVISMHPFRLTKPMIHTASNNRGHRENGAEVLSPGSRKRWEDLRPWKMDLKGAHTLQSFRPEDSGLFEIELTDDLICLQIARTLPCTPAAFQVVTRAFKWELIHVYIDDIIAVCLDKDLALDLLTAKGVCMRLLGKTEWGIRLDILGWCERVRAVVLASQGCRSYIS